MEVGEIMAGLGDISVRLGLNAKDFRKGLQKAENNMKDFGNTVRDAGAGMSTAITLPLLAVGAGAIKVGADFEKSMKKVQAVTGASEKQFGKLSEEARNLGASTKYSANEVADAMGFLGMAGFDTGEILEATGGMLNLASVANLDLASTADIASNMLTGMGMEASEINKVVDIMTETMTNSNVDIQMLGESFKYVAPLASQLGVDLGELSGAIGFMGDAGLQGSMAGTSLATGLTRLASPTKESSELMKKLGIEVFNAEGNLKSLPDVLSELEGGFSGLSTQQQTSAMSTIFGMEAMKGWNALLSRGSGELEDFAGQLNNSQGAGEEVAKTMSDTFYGALANLKSALDEVGISLYEMIEQPLKNVVVAITDAVSWFNSLSTGTQQFIFIMAGLAMVVPPIVLGIGALVALFGAFAGAIASAVLPVVAITAGIVALAGVFTLAWQKSETFRNAVTNTFNAIKSVVMEVFGFIASFVKQKIAEIQEFWNTHGTQIQQAFSNVVNAIGAVFAVVFPIIKTIVFSVIQNIMGIVDGLITFFQGVIKFFTGVFTGDWKMAWEGIKDIFSGAVQAIWNFIQVTLIGKVLKFFKGFGPKIWNFVKDIGKKIAKPFKDGWQRVKNWVGKLKTGVQNKFTEIKNGIINKLKGLGNRIAQPFKDGWQKVKEWVDKIKNAVKNMFNVDIKIPSFGFSGSLNPMKWASEGLPKLHINWNAKGNIFDGASILGGGQGVGEAGAEAVLPIEHKRYMQPFASAIADHLKDMDEDNPNGGVVNKFNIAELVVREEADVRKIAEELDRIQRKEQRAKGIFAY